MEAEENNRKAENIWIEQESFFLLHGIRQKDRRIYTRT
jgi:hypothetical protein